MDTPTIVIVASVIVVLAVLTWFLLSRRSPQTPGPGANKMRMTAGALGSALRGAWAGGIEPSTWDEMEEALIAADIGVESSAEIVQMVRRSRPSDGSEAKAALAESLSRQFDGKERSMRSTAQPSVILLVGVNGTGKTTTIAKLGNRLVEQGRSVLFAAADTFRAAAAEQLATWGRRLDIPVVAGQEGGDPGSVVYDAVASARARQIDVVLVDTAGRLHGKKNLMAELTKIHRVASSEGGGVDEVFLVLDATAGQNGLTQVVEFTAAIPVTGIVLTKLDGTAKGGIVVAIERSLGVPVKFVGVGEGVEDLEVFEPDRFVEELLEEA